jgi:uncharacterized protein YecE (DUF72 family)
MSDRAKIYIGTSGWSYPNGEGTWKGHFYPPGKINELEYYSRYFNTVEINSSFYRPPNPGYVYNWVKRVPADFLFTVKLWQKFTHPKMYEEATGRNSAVSQEDVDIFKSSIEPLVRSGKLGALLAQFPPSFKNDDYGRQILGAVINTFSEYKLAVELRHRSWSDDENTTRLLSENHISWVSIDEPQFSSSVAADVPLTSDIAYFRFHGRNKENWWNGNTETRYKYLYSDQELNELSGKIEAVAGKTKLVFAFFNNHWQAYAPKNAISIKRTLQLPFPELPMMKEFTLPDINEQEQL